MSARPFGLALVLAVSACVSGLDPGELGVGRRVGVFPGTIPATLPPLTDRRGDVYVATGMLDASGRPAPGTALIGSAQGGFTDGCPTGAGPRGAARGWVGATDTRAWLWTDTALLQLDAITSACVTQLDRDPIGDSDLLLLGVASTIAETASGPSTLAIVETAADMVPTLAVLDLELGTIRSSHALGALEVLGAGADASRTEGLFLVRDASSVRVLVGSARDGAVTTVPVDGEATTLTSELVGGTDGSLAGLGSDGALMVGTRSGLRREVIDGAVGIEVDDDGELLLVGERGEVPFVAPIRAGEVAEPRAWQTAARIDRALAAGVVVLDERGGMRTAERWVGHGAFGTSALVWRHDAPPYAVGTRELLVADPPMDRAGVIYSQLAVVPVGVALE